MSNFYNKYPYTDFHELNLDWVIERVKQLTEDWLETKQTWENTEADWQELYNYVHDYFNNLDVQEEINTKINAMIADGTFQAVLQPFIDEQISILVSAWLEEHVSPTTPIVDDTLTISGAAADALVVGQRFDTVNANFENIAHIGKNIFSAEWVNGKGLSGAGAEVDSVRNALSGYFAVLPSTVYTAKLYGDDTTYTNLYVSFFDSNKDFISSPASVTTDNINFTTPATCYFARLMTYQSATTGTGLVPDHTQVEKGYIITSYEPYGFHFINNNAINTDVFLVNSGQPADAGAVGNIFDDISQPGKNIFNSTWTNGIQIDNDGYEKGSVRNAVSGYVKVNASQTYTAKCYGSSLTFTNIYAIQYDADMVKISATGAASTQITFTTAATCAYIRLMTYQSATTGTGLVPDNTQIEKGSAATLYEDYAMIINPDALKAGLDLYAPTEKLYNPITLVNCSLVSESNENSYKDNDILYQADSIVISVNGNTAVGLEWYLFGCQAGNAIRINGSRSTGNNFFVRFVAKDDSDNTLKQSFFNMNDDITFIIPVDTYRINITMAACWGTALTSGTQVTFSNIKIVESATYGTGYDLYTGDHVSLSYLKNNTMNRCNISEWKSFTSVGSYNLHKAQGMALYDDYMFIFRDGGGGIVVDYNTKNIISEFATTPTSNNHQNSASFTNLFYDDDDEFPMIMVSRCIGPTYDECLIYRITRSDTTFTFTEVNTIRFDATTYGTTWGIDLNHRKLVATTLLNGDWQVTTNNPINVLTFEIPAYSDIISGNEIQLTFNDIVEQTILPHQVPQGITVYNGYVWSAVQVGTGKTPTIWRIDQESNQVINSITLKIVREPEDVAIYNEKLYVSQVDSTDTSGTNPLIISEITF